LYIRVEIFLFEVFVPESKKTIYIMGIPTSYLIDADGKIRENVSGART